MAFSIDQPRAIPKTLDDLHGDYTVVSSPTQHQNFSIDQRNQPAPKANLDSSMASLGFSQSVLDNIARGNAKANVEQAKGFAKGALESFSNAGAQNAGPVGAQMKANAQGFFDPLEQVVKPSNPDQALGKGQESVAELGIPLGVGAKAKGTAESVTGIIDRHIGSAKQVMDGLPKEHMDALGGMKSLLGQTKENIKLSLESAGMKDAAQRVANIPHETMTTLDELATKATAEGQQTEGKIVTGIGNKISDYIENRNLNKSINAISPKLTAGEMEASPNVIKPRFGAPKVDFTKDKALKAIAQDTKGIVKGKSAIDDKNALRAAIETASEKEIKPFLAENKVPANFEDLQKKLEMVHPQSSLKADPTASKTYDRVREEVQANIYSSLKTAAKNKGDFGSSTDFNDVWNARKILDTKAEEELGTRVFGSAEYTGAKAAIQDLRQGLTQYIKDSLQFPGQMEDVNKMQEFLQVARGRGIDIGSTEAKMLMEQMGIKATPEGIARAKTFEDTMGKVSNYYKAIDNISTKVPDEIRANATFGKRHPVIQKVLQGLGIGSGIGLEEEVRQRI